MLFRSVTYRGQNNYQVHHPDGVFPVWVDRSSKNLEDPTRDHASYAPEKFYHDQFEDSEGNKNPNNWGFPTDILHRDDVNQHVREALEHIHAHQKKLKADGN